MPATSSSKTKAKAKSRHPWRENIEALLVAVIVALTLKYFFLEISKIPSGSMQPTLMGSPEIAVFDRVLVDKVSFQFRDPERFEIVVFKHPLERSRNMVKRVVGMPGEDIRLAYGDVFTRPTGTEEWTILRRPDDIQEEMWRELRPDGWDPLGEPITLGVGRVVRYRSPGQSTVIDSYLDGYPDGLRKKLARFYGSRGRSQVPVGDLRVRGEVEPEPSCESLILELREGTRHYTFTIPGPRAADDAVATIGAGGYGYPGDAPGPARSEKPVRLEAGETVSFSAENLDDRLALRVDGELVATLDIPFAGDQASSIQLVVSGGAVVLSELRAERDIYYLPRGESIDGVTVGDDHYFMLGDNTQDSADGREWQGVTYAWQDEAGEHRARGNLRRGENPASGTDGSGQHNVLFFRNEWGDRSSFAMNNAEELDVEYVPSVPRHLIHGRVFAVFWPLKPWDSVWRLGWTR